MSRDQKSFGCLNDYHTHGQKQIAKNIDPAGTTWQSGVCFKLPEPDRHDLIKLLALAQRLGQSL